MLKKVKTNLSTYRWQARKDIFARLPSALIIVTSALGILTLSSGSAPGASPQAREGRSENILAAPRISARSSDDAFAASASIEVRVNTDDDRDLAPILAQAFEAVTAAPLRKLDSAIERITPSRYLVTFSERPRGRIAYPGGNFQCSGQKCNDGEPINIRFINVAVSIQLDPPKQNGTADVPAPKLSYVLEGRAAYGTHRVSSGVALLAQKDAPIPSDGKIKEHLTIPDGWLLSLVAWLSSEPNPRAQITRVQKEAIFDLRTSQLLSDGLERAPNTISGPSSGILSSDYSVALIPRDSKNIDQLEQAIASGRVEILDGDKIIKVSERSPPINGSRQDFLVGTQSRKGISLGSFTLAAPTKLSIKIDKKDNGKRLALRDYPNTLAFEVALIEAVVQPFTVRFRPVEMRYGKPIPIDPVLLDGCSLSLKTALRGNEKVEMKIEGAEMVSSPLNLTAQDRRSLLDSLSVVVAGEQKRVGGDCPHLNAVAGGVEVNESKHQITGILDFAMRPWLLILAAPQRMSAGVPTGLELETENRERELWRSVLTQLDQLYRNQRNAFLSGDLLLLSAAKLGQPSLPDRFVVGGLKDRREPNSLEVSGSELTAILSFEDKLSAPPDAADVVDTVNAYRRLHGNNVRRSVSVVLGATLADSPQQVVNACQRWTNELASLRNDGVSTVAFLAVGQPAAEIRRVLRLAIGSSSILPGGLHSCPTNRTGELSSVYIYSFRDLVENTSDAPRQIGTLAGTIREVVSREALP